MAMISQHQRWRDYFLQSGMHFGRFWTELLSEERQILIILGHGFDSRMCSCANEILEAGGSGQRDALVVEFYEGVTSHSRRYSHQREENGKRLETIFNGRGQIKRRKVKMFSGDGRWIGARSITNKFTSMSEFLMYTDIVVDVSSLPKTLYFPMLSKLLTLFDKRDSSKTYPNLHVVVAHSPELDARISEEEFDETATFLHGFSAAQFEQESTRDQPIIWMPIIGSSDVVALQRIEELVHPSEVCPVLPSPAMNPRESDDRILRFREFLFDGIRVEPQNIIYASESNPFEVYRQLMRSILHYKQALEPLGGCKAVLSALSSKLLSLGAVLAAYELSQSRAGIDRVDVGVAHVQASGYRVIGELDLNDHIEHFSLWLTGECYDTD